MMLMDISYYLFGSSHKKNYTLKNKINVCLITFYLKKNGVKNT